MFCGKNGEPKLTEYIGNIRDRRETVLPIVLHVLPKLTSMIQEYYV